MTQTVPATAVLGPGATGLTIGLRVLNLDGTEYAAFSTTGVSETSMLGTYRKASGVACPDAGAYIVWGVSGTDYAEATVEPITALSDIQARLPAALIGGRIDASVGAMAADTLTASALATDAVTEISTAISSTAGSGALTTTVTVNDENAQPLDGVEVWVTSDSAGTTVVAGTLTTNAAGVVTFMLDAGTYYLWRQLSRYNFTNPTTIVVS